ncbi:hypothetical protein BGI40_10410 [Snodgrassella communis]|jgi:hypothetical protein|uniref:Uncharacterized protein n=1 Tax=Snodgrassella communis TaxID=2946699 RepID=A0A066TK58_9NEIS|nr:hypothetical protein [Snodgrassella communis]KDN12496.1 hypothetical protein SALWKB12_1020 [Snodgrassella communis]KDN15511.1 hypothetical protein SALWKB29_0615 [Snodgrassella communis]PIT07191.1 hypothetical protein BGI29_09810 [Snodgrassella communis]PIT19798.1 hypothetical protein BGI36_09965 [Snodgrassella communis]PIT22441.1 hypothetical protein BGI35_04210 [Snodgrassella communis]
MKRWLCILILCLAGCIDDRSEQEKNKQLQDKLAMKDTTEITVLIPSKVSGKKLEITLPRCFFNPDMKIQLVNGKVERKGLTIIYPLPTFSGFPNNEQTILQCPDFNKPITGLGVGILYPKIGQTTLEYGNYWLKQQSYQYSVIEKRNNQILYNVGVGGKRAIFADKSNKNQEDISIEFWPYDAGNADSPFPDQIEVHSVFNREFTIGYTIYTSKFLHGKHKPLPNQWYFADALIDIYKHNESLLDHPEIVQGFIENNNRILDYIHQHSKVIE